MAQRAGGVLRRGTDRVVAGVCSGLAQYFGVDPLVVRLVFVVLALVHGVGLLLYLLLWLLMEPASGEVASDRPLGARVRTMVDEIRDDFRGGVTGSPLSANRRSLWVGALLILIGVYFFLDNLGLLSWINWGIVWPIVLIAIGAALLLRRRW